MRSFLRPATVCRLDEEISSLLAAGFSRYLSIQLYCKAHGFFRGNIAAFEIGETWPCPECLAPCPCGIVGSGGVTRGPLPQWAQLFARIQWERVHEDLELPPRQSAPVCVQCGHEFFTSLHGHKKRLCPDCSEAREKASARKRNDRRGPRGTHGACLIAC